MSLLSKHLAALSAALLLVTAPATAADDDTVSLNFVNAEIEAVIKAIGKITGRNFLIDPRVRGNLNIVTNTPVPKSLTFDILLSALRLQGYTAVASAGVIKIVPEADAKLHAVPVGRDGRALAGAGLSTQVFILKNESAAQLVPVLRPLISPNNTVTAYPANNALVVTDYADNLARIARIIASVDVPQGDLQVIGLKHAAAADLADTVSRLLNDTGRGGAGQVDASQHVTVVPEAHSNSLLVRADNPARISAVRQLVAALDRPGAGGNIHVVYLKNAEAEDVAETLAAVLSGATTTAAARTTTSLAAGSQDGTAASTGSGARSAPATASVGNGTIQADIANNALIITAPDAIYRNLRSVIDQLDRRRAQVYVEALIAEVTAERSAEWGLQWAAGAGVGSGRSGIGIIGGTSFTANGNSLNGLIGNAAAGTPSLPGNGVNIAIGGGSVSIPGLGSIPNLAVLARFLESDTKANILSAPNLVMLDNEEAKIVVGQNRPFITGQYTSTGGGSLPENPFQTIERRDVGLTLRVKPQITEGGVIRMQIYQESSALFEETANGPITNTRSMESVIQVDDGGIIALGGLVEDSYASGEEKVPFLGDLPIAGALFRYDTRRRTKTNLVIFLRPVILRDADGYGRITNARYDYVIGQQRKLRGDDELLRGEPEPPELPPLGTPVPAVPVARVPVTPMEPTAPAASADDRIETPFVEP
ncbi:MAG: type II secretion system secretin GspD [Zoogloeaceae bacterium]|nr:type II secretion system secretin GspD [Rhodocyclaceae bacterium]MCP5234506.1 type II secretion system secretin GspD [Zoogloeaceae bacterium]